MARFRHNYGTQVSFRLTGCDETDTCCESSSGELKVNANNGWKECDRQKRMKQGVFSTTERCLFLMLCCLTPQRSRPFHIDFWPCLLCTEIFTDSLTDSFKDIGNSRWWNSHVLCYFTLKKVILKLFVFKRVVIPSLSLLLKEFLLDALLIPNYQIFLQAINIIRSEIFRLVFFFLFV